MDKEKAKQVSSVWLRSPATTKTESFDLIRNLWTLWKSGASSRTSTAQILEGA
jgi:hypothetical protein